MARPRKYIIIVNVKINLTFTIIILLILPCTSVPCGHSVHIGTGERKNIFFVHYSIAHSAPACNVEKSAEIFLIQAVFNRFNTVNIVFHLCFSTLSTDFSTVKFSFSTHQTSIPHFQQFFQQLSTC